MSLYSPIMDMNSNALTKRFCNDLRQIMDDQEENITEANIEDRKEIGNLLKDRLFCFYFQSLYFTSRNDAMFRKRLAHSG
jgi:hypothetical protein